MKLSIVIVSYNVKYFLEQCLRSVARASAGIKCETLVVDNASTDGTIDYIKDKFPQVSFIENKENVGFARANNQAINISKGEYVLLLNPDTIVEKYGADTLRMYEMFLGPVEQSKPWDTNGIDGCHRFLRRLWNLFYDKDDNLIITDEQPTKEELKSIHKLIKKTTEDIPAFSYNTTVSAFMICANELGTLKCNKRAILENFVIVLAPFAPHICEEIWESLGHTTSVCDAQWPTFNEEYLKEDTIKYTISFNGKARFTMDFATDADKAYIESTVLADEMTKKYIEDKPIKKVIVVPKKIVNIVF